MCTCVCTCVYGNVLLCAQDPSLVNCYSLSIKKTRRGLRSQKAFVKQLTSYFDFMSFMSFMLSSSLTWDVLFFNIYFGCDNSLWHSS